MTVDCSSGIQSGTSRSESIQVCSAVAGASTIKLAAILSPYP